MSDESRQMTTPDDQRNNGTSNDKVWGEVQHQTSPGGDSIITVKCPYCARCSKVST